MTGAGESADWRSCMTGRLDDLGRWIEGRFLAEPGRDDTLIPAVRFFEPDRLRQAISDICPLPAPSAPATKETDFIAAIAASKFARWYASSLTAVALTGLACGVGLDLSPQRCTLTPRRVGQFSLGLDLADEEILRCRQRPTDWPVTGPIVDGMAELRAHVWATLYGAHLKPLFGKVLDLVKVSEALLWTSAAEYVANVADSAEEYLTTEEARPFVAERQALLEAATLPGVPGPNPLRDTLDRVPVTGDGFPATVTTRRLCCLNYLLEIRGGTLCQNCPHLPLENRVQLVRERHGVPVGTPPGPAAEEAKRIGAQRLSHRRLQNLRIGRVE